jgi:two-component system chemotaxis response regulator CheY
MAGILIIDDDILQHRIIELQLNKIAPQHIVSFFEGKSAIEYLGQNENSSDVLPDIILLDINMPIMNGWEFLAAFDILVDIIEKDISVFVVSSSIDPNDKYRALSRTYVKDYISKPLANDFLKRLVKDR